MKNEILRWPPWHGGHLGFPIKMILATFDLQVTLMLPTKFQVDWTFGPGEEAKNRFSRWPHGTSHPDASYQVSSQLAQGCWRSRLLKHIVDATQLTTYYGKWTLDFEHFVFK